MRSFTLRTGAQIPAVGVLLTPDLSNLYPHARAALIADAGRLDGAGPSAHAKVVGRALAEHADGCEPGDVFLSWRLTADDVADPRAAVAAVGAITAALGAVRLDLALIPWASVGQGAHGATIVAVGAALSALRADGRAAAIGLVDAPVQTLEALARAGALLPDVIETSAHPEQPCAELLSACASHGVHLTTRAPLGPGAGASSDGIAGAALLEHPVVRDVADRLAMNPAQVLFAWALARGTSASSPATTPARIMRHLDTPHLVLARADIAALDGISASGARAAVA